MEFLDFDIYFIEIAPLAMGAMGVSYLLEELSTLLKMYFNRKKSEKTLSLKGHSNVAT